MKPLLSLPLPKVLVLIVIVAIQALHGASSPWPQFRGPGGKGLAGEQSIPLSFTATKDLLWKAPVPLGHSSPCITGDRIFLTAHEGTTLKGMCLNRQDGKTLWLHERTIEKVPAYEHAAGDPANSTPATDGENVVFYFDDYGVIVTDLKGHIKWEKTMPTTSNTYSYGASPLLHEGKIYLNRDGGVDSSLVCLDIQDGSEIWRASHPQFLVSFCTPYLTEQNGTKLVLSGGTGMLFAYEAATGKPVWHVGGFPVFICPSPVATKDTVIFGGWTTAHVSGRTRVESGFDPDSGVSEASLKSPEAFFEQFDTNKDGKLIVDEFPPSRARDAFNFLDKNDDGFIEMAEWAPGYENAQMAPGRNVMLAVNKGGTGDVTQSHIRWELTKGLPYVASPLAYRDRVYMVATGGFVTCVDLNTGKPYFEKERLRVPGEYYASPLAVGDHILICSQRGTVFLIKAADQLEIEHRTDLKEKIFATPAIVDNKIYLRSENHIWAFGK